MLALEENLTADHSGEGEQELLPTRASLLSRLRDWQNDSWREFFELYWKLIYNTARRYGLSDAEAQDVVQETVITVARKIDKLRYDPALGSFKGWLLNITRWRIADQFRKRAPSPHQSIRSPNDSRTGTIERVVDSNAASLDDLWEREWQENLLAAAMARVKRKVAPRHFQIFDCSVRKQWSAQKIATTFGISAGQVYLVRHRVAALLKKEVKALEKGSR